MFDKILISRCFLGEKVRYNSEVIALKHPLLTLWQQQNRFIAICPEIAGGLSVPREPAEQNQVNGEILTCTGVNVTKQFNVGAQQSLALCQQHHIRFALLKESSPSCGSTLIYDGTFANKKIAGQGVTSQLLTQAGIQVFSENTIEALATLLDK
ncbi:MAG: DUF523 domain-containing protein [Colwellia sp.]|nr:DUF523 domain-containing protein [Colwellia sp.]MCW8864776.1 DUF523 domain-containing protein [Colwellia sp.]MCW9081853.1 DUF523 domain-containing protein [Colwellia sp.]